MSEGWSELVNAVRELLELYRQGEDSAGEMLDLARNRYQDARPLVASLTRLSPNLTDLAIDIVATQARVVAAAEAHFAATVDGRVLVERLLTTLEG